MKWGCWGHWGQWSCWGCRGHWGCRGCKAWKISTEDFRVIQVLEFGSTLMFWEKNWNIKLNSSALSARGFWGQPMVLFWKLVDQTQISKSTEPTRHHNSIKLWIPLPLRADLLSTLQLEGEYNQCFSTQFFPFNFDPQFCPSYLISYKVVWMVQFVLISHNSWTQNKFQFSCLMIALVAWNKL